MAAYAALIAISIVATSVSAQQALVEAVRIPAPGACRATVDAAGHWTVVVPARQQVWGITSTGKIEARVGGYGWTETSLDGPAGIAGDGLSLFVADHGNHRIVRYDRGLRFLSLLQTRESSSAQARFGFPMDVAANSRGDLVVVDGEAQEVAVYGSGGRYLWRAGKDLPGGTQLRHPVAVAVGPQDEVFVLDGGTIRRFDQYGNHRGMLSAGFTTDAQEICVGEDVVVACNRDTLCVIPLDGRAPSVYPRKFLSLDAPPDALSDVCWFRGLVYVVDGRNIIGYRIE